MGDELFDPNAKLEITCPQCSKKFKATIRELKGKSKTCPGCGLLIDGTEFSKGLKKAEDDLKRAFRGFGK